jgi:hypothetical protein
MRSYIGDSLPLPGSPLHSKGDDPEATDIAPHQAAKLAIERDPERPDSCSSGVVRPLSSLRVADIRSVLREARRCA